MLLEILNKDFVVTDIVDNFESLIWTDRYREYGDFELYTSTSDKSIQHTIKAEIGCYLRLDSSEHIMIVEAYKIDTDVENGDKITLSGRSAESILQRRIVWKKTTFDGKFQNGIAKLLNQNIINPEISYRKINNFVFERSTDDYISSLDVRYQFTGDNLYDAIKALCDRVNVGFKVTLNDDNQFVFSLYYGKDRTYDQTDNPYVIFSPSYDNIITSNYLESNKELRTTALVAGEDEGLERVTHETGNITSSGVDRYELYVDARDIQSETELYSEDLVTRMSLLGFNAAGTEIVNASSDRMFYIHVRPNSEYRIQRDYSYSEWHLRVGTTENVPELGVQPTQCITTEEGSGYEATITTGDNDNYILIQLFKEIDITEHSATYENSLEGMSIKGKMPDSDYIAQLDERGNEKLAPCRYVQSFDAEAEPNANFKYNRDYFMGDILQMQNEYGIQAKTRVIELIKSQSSSGYEEYPTFETIFDEEE